eukprot:scaffold1705_cov255-Chaetoceros_neogracile.AAC.6
MRRGSSRGDFTCPHDCHYCTERAFEYKAKPQNPSRLSPPPRFQADRKNYNNKLYQHNKGPKAKSCSCLLASVFSYPSPKAHQKSTNCILRLEEYHSITVQIQQLLLQQRMCSKDWRSTESAADRRECMRHGRQEYIVLKSFPVKVKKESILDLGPRTLTL